MLRDILSITGKPGLYKLVSRGNNMLIVESLLDGKRMPTYARDKIVSLGEISMYTMGEDIALSEVLTKLGEKEGLKVAALDPKKADNDELRAFFGEVLPDFDRDRVYPSDILLYAFVLPIARCLQTGNRYRPRRPYSRGWT